jgi:hypothetical protein
LTSFLVLRSLIITIVVLALLNLNCIFISLFTTSGAIIFINNYLNVLIKLFFFFCCQFIFHRVRVTSWFFFFLFIFVVLSCFLNFFFMLFLIFLKLFKYIFKWSYSSLALISTWMLIFWFLKCLFTRWFIWIILLPIFLRLVVFNLIVFSLLSFALYTNLDLFGDSASILVNSLYLFFTTLFS